ncbi:hypothetical protein Ndes2526B_g09120 [Nannochloris sp. 'desiccata']|nr:hypothetical protein KSW81_001334 [Chlorella desiccata (nom. nud.)]KAH7617013.1 hypothetical protein NADE_001815 [Chlorella desiccata (nom. nud.)]
MQTTLKVKISSPSMGMARAPKCTRLACRCQLSSSRPASAQQQQTSPSSSAAIERASLVFAASMLPLVAARPAFADEIAAPATDAAATAVTTAPPIIFGMTALDLGISFTPVLVYALFTLYRDKVNPRAKFGDLIFIIAALVVFGNIFSVLIFKKRLY